ncbi:hypothetical protein D3C86_2017600 [compost metagenome]
MVLPPAMLVGWPLCSSRKATLSGLFCLAWAASWSLWLAISAFSLAPAAGLSSNWARVSIRWLRLSSVGAVAMTSTLTPARRS